MVSNDRELNVIKEVYRLSLPDIAEDGLRYFYQLDKFNASAEDWAQLSAHIHRLGIGCQLFEFDCLCELCFDLEFRLENSSALFQLGHLSEIEKSLLQIKGLAQISCVELPISSLY